jgi:hypothetical protein
MLLPLKRKKLGMGYRKMGENHLHHDMLDFSLPGEKGEEEELGGPTGCIDSDVGRLPSMTTVSGRCIPPHNTFPSRVKEHPFPVRNLPLTHAGSMQE